MIDYRVYLVTDEPFRYRGDWLDNVIAAVEGGATCVQYRDPVSNGRERYARALRLVAALHERGVPMVVNNDPALAVAVGADGVHVGQGDLPPEAVRRVVGPRLEIGLSLTAVGQTGELAGLVSAGFVNVVGVGPVFDATATKSDAAPAMGIDGLKEMLELVGGVPAVAIGGITVERAMSVVRAGADGIAVVSAFSRSSNPIDVARRLRALF